MQRMFRDLCFSLQDQFFTSLDNVHLPDFSFAHPICSVEDLSLERFRKSIEMVLGFQKFDLEVALFQ